MPPSLQYKVEIKEPDYTVEAAFRTLANDAVLEVARHILKESQEIVPVRTGALKRSGRIEQTGRGQHSIIYGGITDQATGKHVNYAAAVHERDLNYRHGRWQYLAEPLRNSRTLLEQARKAYVKGFLKYAKRRLVTVFRRG